MLARAYRSPIAHRLVAPLRTACGLDATLMARWSPSDAGADRRTWRRCRSCG